MVLWGPCTRLVRTVSLKEMIAAKIAELVIAGQRCGNSISMNARRAFAPDRYAASRSTVLKVDIAVSTMRNANGKALITWAAIMVAIEPGTPSILKKNAVDRPMDT